MYDIYHSDQNDQWRYTLGRSGARPLLVIGLNPSTATQEKLDPTVTRVEKVAQQCGFDGFVMLNLYPVRATNPQDLPSKADPVAYERNLEDHRESRRSIPQSHLWAAWGETVVNRTYFLRARDTLHERLAQYQPQWRRFGELTANGHPRHPSRLNYAWTLEPYELA
jgi:hypothetical protein